MVTDIETARDAVMVMAPAVDDVVVDVDPVMAVGRVVALKLAP